MPEVLEQAVASDAGEAITEAVEEGTRAVSRAADIVEAEVTNAGLTAVVGAIDRVMGTQNRLIQLVEAQSNMIQENLNALSRAQANTDVSAQRAAEATTTIAEELTPEEKSEPDQGERPEPIKELPKSERSEGQYYKLGFGKAAARHGDHGRR